MTSRAEPLPGCVSTPLGRMRYRPRASPAFAARWFPAGVDAASLGRAPVVDFDRKDDLQARFIASVAGRRLDPPRHQVPASADFALAVRLGLGWGMVPDAQAEGTVTLSDAVLDVPLYWQQWNLRSPLLDAVSAEVVAAARGVLTPADSGSLPVFGASRGARPRKRANSRRVGLEDAELHRG